MCRNDKSCSNICLWLLCYFDMEFIIGISIFLIGIFEVEMELVCVIVCN